MNKFIETCGDNSEVMSDGGELATIQYGDYVNFTKDSEQTNSHGNPIYRKGSGGNVINIITRGDKTFYDIKHGMTEYKDVPLSDVVLYKKDVREKVEEILTERQTKKAYKDVGKRVSGSQKEKIVTGSLINLSDLPALEEDELTAVKMVVKEKVYPQINIEEQKAMGVTSGAVFIKVETRKACGNTPPNRKDKRASYVKFINKFSEDTLNLKTVKEIKAVYQSYLKWNAVEIMGYFIDPLILNVSDELKEKAQKMYEQTFRYREHTVVKTMVTEIFGKRLSNFMFIDSDSASSTWREAESFEPISKEESELLILKYKERKEKDIAINQKKVDEYKGYSTEELKRVMNNNWSFTPIYRKIMLQDMEQFRKYATDYYQKRLDSSKEELEKIPSYIQQHENNWEWYEKAPEKKEIERSNEVKINTGKPLAFIKRTGGVKISEEYVEQTRNTDQAKNPITGDFGFKTVQYGQSLADNQAREHIRHFLGAMSDLSELLGIDIKALNSIAGLSISFASRGKGGYSATYEAGRKIINISNRRGDGAVAHEYFHYIDNALASHGKQGLTLDFATEKPDSVQNSNVRNKIKEIMEFIHKGKIGVTEPTKVLFRKTSRSYQSVPRFYSAKLGISKELTLANTIDETLEILRSEYPNIMSESPNYPDNQARFISYIINHFGLNEYEVSLSSSTSNFYYGSAKLSSAYWVKEAELFARASETYVTDKLLKSGRFNNYLVNDEMFGFVTLKGGEQTQVYPYGAEREYLYTLYDDLISTMKVEYNLSGFSPISEKREDEYLVLEEKQTTEENVDTGIVVDSKTKVPEEVIHDNVDVLEEAKVDFTKQDYMDALDGANTMLEFAEAEEKQGLQDYIESLKTMISIMD